MPRLPRSLSLPLLVLVAGCAGPPPLQDVPPGVVRSSPRAVEAQADRPATVVHLRVVQVGGVAAGGSS